LLENFKKSILKKNTKYNEFNKEINLIVYCIDGVFPYYNGELYKEIIMKEIKNKISNNFIEFKPTNNIFNKIFLVLINQINDEQYYYSVVIIDYK
jgi:hypothetical protein